MRKGLGDLKNAFMLYLVGSVLTFVPVVGAIGGIISLVALILLIIGWRALGRSSLKESGNYRSTGSWLIYAIILVIVVTIVGSIVIVASVVLYFASHPIPSSTPSNITSLSQIPWIFPIIYGLGALFALLFSIWYGVWIKMCNSMKRLSVELSQPRLKTAANLYIIQIVAFVGLAILFIVFLSYVNLSSFYSSYASLLTTNRNLSLFGVYAFITFGGYWTLLGLASIASTTLSVIIPYLAYSALGSAIGKLAPIAPPQMNAGQFCPHCGHAVDPSNNFCPSCGWKLKN